MLYGQHARQNGNTELATLYEASAKTERGEHFAEEAHLAGLVGTDADSLKDAIKGASYVGHRLHWLIRLRLSNIDVQNRMQVDPRRELESVRGEGGTLI